MEKKTKGKRSGNPNPKPLPPGPGRPKGVPNKFSGLAKENIVAVFDKIGGIDAMAVWAMENQSEFYKLYARLLPVQVQGDDEGGPVVIQIVKYADDTASE